MGFGERGDDRGGRLCNRWQRQRGAGGCCGGGYGGATAAKYVKMWAPDIDVTLVEPNQHFISCPISNLVLGGNAQMGDITFSYDGLRQRGIR